MMARKMFEDRFVGCLVGLAVGDALGAPVEFARRGSFPAVTGYRGGGPYNLPPGTWTDDTIMALCLAESLVERGDFDPQDQMERYCRWYQEGYMSPTGKCFDIGATTEEALQRFLATGEYYAATSSPDKAGNGSLMRIAPIPMFFSCAPRVAINNAKRSSRTTHAARDSVSACRYFAGLLVGALLGESKEDLLSYLYSPVGGFWSSEPLAPGVAAIAQGKYKEKQRDQIQSSGYVLHTLEAALWAFHQTDNFRDALLLAVNLGGDSDTIGAVCGQIAGAFYGHSGIPEEWRDGLHSHKKIVRTAEQLQPGPRWDPRIKKELVESWHLFKKAGGKIGDESRQADPPSGAYIPEAEHKEVRLRRATDPPMTAAVDEGIAPLIAALWDLGFHTHSSCQANILIDGLRYAWIEFESLSRSFHPLELLNSFSYGDFLRYVVGEERDDLYWRVTRNAPLGNWQYYFYVEDESLYQPRKPRAPYVSWNVGLRFPVVDIPLVTERIQKERDSLFDYCRHRIERLQKGLRSLAENNANDARINRLRSTIQACESGLAYTTITKIRARRQAKKAATKSKRTRQAHLLG